MMRRTNIARVLTTGVALVLLSTALSTGASGDARRSGPTATHDHATASTSYAGLTSTQTRRLAGPLARARAATARYATDPEVARADGYEMQITQNIPDMGYHFLNPDITEFDITRPPILVYVRNGDDWQLVAFEWVFPAKPEERPLPGARYGSFPAACHYENGEFVFEDDEAACSTASPVSAAAFTFWHPPLVTLHVWVWYPNPDGLFSGTNRWVRPFNDEQV
jgi:hypothetical protein